MGKYFTKWYRTTNDLYNVINIKIQWPLASRRSFFGWVVECIFYFHFYLVEFYGNHNKATSHFEDISGADDHQANRSASVISLANSGGFLAITAPVDLFSDRRIREQNVMCVCVFAFCHLLRFNDFVGKLSRHTTISSTRAVYRRFKWPNQLDSSHMHSAHLFLPTNTRGSNESQRWK